MKYLLLPLTLSLSLLTACAQQISTPQIEQGQIAPLPGFSSQEPTDKRGNEAETKVVEQSSPDADVETVELPIDAWQKIAQAHGFAGDINNTQVSKYRDWYTGKQRYFDRLGTRAQLYMAHIVEELERNELPLELALLPFVESAYNPFAYSPSGAAGLWQFMRPTGDHLGLKRDQWYDGRRDVVSSTDAAIRYFQYLNKRFDGDWLLTLAAYNAGEGTVRKAIRANRRQGKASDFWSLRLPAETRAYVPKLIALAQVTASPADFQVVLPEIPTQVYFQIVELPQQIDLYQVSLLADMSIDGVYRLNPGCQQSATPPEGPHRLLIPQHKTASFQSRLNSTPKDRWLIVREYKVQQGDTLSEIAQHHGLGAQALMAQNNMTSSRIRAGQVLKIPSISSAYLPSFARPTQYYRVRRGDSLWKIAHAYQVKTVNLARWNGLKHSAPLKIGKRLKIRAPVPVSQSRQLSYKIKKGDSLSLISKQFKVSVRDIVRWNKLNSRGFIKAGQTLSLFPRS
ncbi:MAG: LysM peptidoglycan-binding domain-containing protein [Gammaproteobacteria bacterium]|nr:LysM peptidoglycan-binding domain-containing protein [Gammaproteobacteria bacterium]MBQ0838962.1 LysM peptidoglycan-binding domain-containing protein [Gammaproteobacteria bacterium]